MHLPITPAAGPSVARRCHRSNRSPAHICLLRGGVAIASTAWAYRHLTEGLATQPDGFSVDLEAMATWLSRDPRVVVKWAGYGGPHPR